MAPRIFLAMGSLLMSWLHTSLKSKGNVWALREWMVGIPLDARSFVPLRDGYAKDQTRVVWLGLNERGAATLVDGADAESLVVDDQGAHDRHGTLICGMRASGPLPVELEPDPLAAATALIQSVWRELVGHCFSHFDGGDSGPRIQQGLSIYCRVGREGFNEVQAAKSPGSPGRRI